MTIETIHQFAQHTGIYAFMYSPWGWPIVESLHFIGLAMLLGTVWLYDLRMLGIGKGIDMAILSQLIPFGVAGYAINLSTGLLFFVSAPDQYAYNPAFQLKLCFMLLAGINMVVFYRYLYRGVLQVGIDQPAPLNARLIAIISMVCWTMVIVFGRLITYFRPPYHWCFWC